MLEAIPEPNDNENDDEDEKTEEIYLKYGDNDDEIEKVEKDDQKLLRLENARSHPWTKR